MWSGEVCLACSLGVLVCVVYVRAGADLIICQAMAFADRWMEPPEGYEAPDGRQQAHDHIRAVLLGDRAEDFIPTRRRCDL